MLRLLLFLALFTAVSTAYTAHGIDWEGVRFEKDVDYLGPERQEKADLYFPEKLSPEQRCPAIVIIHGGGWTGGDKRAAREQNIGTNFARHGYIGMSINYVLATPDTKEPTWPQNLHDCLTAVRWLRKNADRLQVAPERIGVIGGSAGGHLAAMLGVTRAEDGLDPSGPYAEYSCRVQCAIDMYGPMLWFAQRDLPMFRQKRAEAPDLYQAATPMTHVNPKTPPILILHGTEDKVVSLEDSKAFDSALEKAGVEQQFVIVEGAGHSFDLEPKQKDLRPLVFEFLDKHLRSKP